ncbi:MAG: GNAT family N-acetyltransferase [Marinibacterium sp.]|nr:GNAT family N-acetyltransferase [Marinibacterium sp.]
MTPAIFDVIDATWPAAAMQRHGPWLLRDGQGGGKRVSAVTAAAPPSEGDIADAETAQQALGQEQLFMIRPQDAQLDRWLAARGYAVIDPVTVFRCPVAQLTDRPIPPVTTFVVWEPLVIMAEIWAEGGIGPARLEVMARAAGPKTAILGRIDEKPAGAGFVAIHDGVAMVHALDIRARARRRGLGAWMMRQAAHWAAGQGAHEMTVMCTTANVAACGLYTSLGMRPDGAYHYRIKVKG